MAKRETITGRLIRVETLLCNHLKHHQIWFKCVIAPMAVGVFVSMLSGLFLIVKLVIGG